MNGVQGCVLKIKTIGTSCILCVHIHRNTSPFMIMSANTRNMMMRVFMGSMTLRGFADLQTSLQISLTREGPTGVRAP